MRRFALTAAAAVLAAVPARAGLIGLSSGNPGVLYDVDATTGAATVRTPITTGQSVSTTGLGSLNGVLYATNVIVSGQYTLGTLDPNTGVYTPLLTQTGGWNGLTGAEADGVLYTVDLSTNTLLSITPAGTVTPIGQAGVDVRGLAFDNTNRILYGAVSGFSTQQASLYTVNTTTGAATVVGGFGFTVKEFTGLAFDDTTGTLYLTSSAHAFPGDVDGTKLYRVDTGTGAATRIGVTGLTYLDGLDYFSPGAVPGPGSLALAGLGAGGLVVSRRRLARR